MCPPAGNFIGVIVQILILLGAVGLFLFGMKTMSEALQKLSGHRLRNMLTTMAGSPVRGIVASTAITALVQSSSAVTVMIVSFVNAGMLHLTQAIAMVMGANIGTTVTAWLVVLFGISFDIDLAAVLGEESVPAAGAVKAVAEVVEGVAIAFDAAVEYVPQKLVQLRSGEGCVVSDAEHMTVANGTVVFAVASQACLSGRVYLVAEAGAFYSVETGASSPASSAADALYAFNMLPAGPVLVSASAVYSVGLQIAKNARIDLSFDRAIQWNGESLALIEFVDQYGASVPFAAQYHAEVEGAVLRLVVDEAFSTPSSSQIRVVRVLPVLPGEGIVALNDPQDSCVGEAMMVRVFSLPPLTSRIEVVGAMPVTSNPSLRVVFDQEVKSGAADCAAIIIHDDRSTLSVPVARLTRESATVYSVGAGRVPAEHGVPHDGGPVVLRAG